MDEFTAKLDRIRREHSNNDCREEYVCPECKDTGFVVRIDEEGQEFASRCKCYAVIRARELLLQSGVSEEFSKKSFDNFETRGEMQLEKAKAKATLYAANFIQFEHERRNSILLSGQVGSGKTHLGTAICAELIRNGIAVVYMSYRNAITKIKQSITDEAAYNRELGRYMTARVLYIDDLLKGRLSEADVNIMYEIANYRYMNNMPMIISTEKSPNDLLIFDEAIGSRVIEMCRGNIVKLQGKDLNYRLI